MQILVVLFLYSSFEFRAWSPLIVLTGFVGIGLQSLSFFRWVCTLSSPLCQDLDSLYQFGGIRCIQNYCEWNRWLSRLLDRQVNGMLYDCRSCCNLHYRMPWISCLSTCLVSGTRLVLLMPFLVSSLMNHGPLALFETRLWSAKSLPKHYSCLRENSLAWRSKVFILTFRSSESRLLKRKNYPYIDLLFWLPNHFLVVQLLPFVWYSACWWLKPHLYFSIHFLC